VHVFELSRHPLGGRQSVTDVSCECSDVGTLLYTRLVEELGEPIPDIWYCYRLFRYRRLTFADVRTGGIGRDAGSPPAPANMSLVDFCRSSPSTTLMS